MEASRAQDQFRSAAEAAFRWLLSLGYVEIPANTRVPAVAWANPRSNHFLRVRLEPRDQFILSDLGFVRRGQLPPSGSVAPNKVERLEAVPFRYFAELAGLPPGERTALGVPMGGSQLDRERALAELSTAIANIAGPFLAGDRTQFYAAGKLMLDTIASLRR